MRALAPLVRVYDLFEQSFLRPPRDVASGGAGADGPDCERQGLRATASVEWSERDNLLLRAMSLAIGNIVNSLFSLLHFNVYPSSACVCVQWSACTIWHRHLARP